jgi:hypothetical protein
MLKIVQHNWAPEQGNTCANDAWSVSSNKYLHVCYMTLLGRRAACGVDSEFAVGRPKECTCETLLPEAAGLDAGAFPFRGLML